MIVYFLSHVCVSLYEVLIKLYLQLCFIFFLNMNELSGNTNTNSMVSLYVSVAQWQSQCHMEDFQLLSLIIMKFDRIF